MKKNNELIIPLISSYWKVFRLVFVIFFLYLMGDAFYRWNGFRFYASFSEFLPNLSLISTIWIIIAILTAFFIWLTFKVISFFCIYGKWKNVQRLFLFTYLLVFLMLIFYIIKRFIFLAAPFPLHLKLVAFLGVTLTAIFLIVATERFSHRIEWMNKLHLIKYIYALALLGMLALIISTTVKMTLPWQLLLLLCIPFFSWLLTYKFDLIQERITPLVWLFGLCVIIFIPITAYQITSEHANKKMATEARVDSANNNNRPNMILVTFDALTVKDMSVYGYNRPTTPFITEWAKKASLFTRLIAAGNWTSTTTASLMTGKRIWTHHIFQPHGHSVNKHSFGTTKSSSENLPYLLKQNGYYNMAYIANKYALHKTQYAQHFDINYHPATFVDQRSNAGRVDLNLFRLYGDTILYDWIIRKNFIVGKLLIFLGLEKQLDFQANFSMEKVFNKFIDDIENNPPEPFFSWIHIYQPHAPYLPPKQFKGMFGPLTETDYNSFDNRDRYDEFIRYCDAEFNNFINELKIRNKLKNTIIIVSADHGEVFKDYFFGHGGKFLHEEEVRIPFIIKDYEREEGKVIDNLIEQTDIPATILNLANIHVPAWMEGRSVVPLMNGEGLVEKPAFSMNFKNNPSQMTAKITTGVIAVYEGDYKLIHYPHKEESFLFNLKQDPNELSNLYEKEPEIGQSLLKLLKNNLKKANEKSGKER